MDRRLNRTQGTDDESSNAVWVEAESKEAAMKAGLRFVQSWVGALFEEAQIADIPGWRAGNKAHWIEPEALKRWSGFALETLQRIRA